MTTHQHRWLLTIVSVIFSILPFVQQGTLAGEIQPKPIRLKAVSLPFVSFAPFFIAEEEGYFTEQGLQIELIKMTEAIDSLPAFIKGELDVMADAIYPSYLNAIIRGAKIKIVADKGYHSVTGCPFSAIMARRSLMEEGKLQTIYQLKGRRIGMRKGYSVTGYYMEKVLNQANLTLTDVEIVYLSMPALLGAFQAGSIDISSASEPWVTRIQQSGHGVIWIPAKQLSPHFQHAFIMFGPTLLEKNQEVGRRFMIAYLKAVRQYNHGKTERNLKILAKHTRLDDEILGKTCWPAIRENGQINIESILDYQSWALKKNFIDKEIYPNQFWDPSFIEYANRVLSTSMK